MILAYLLIGAFIGWISNFFSGERGIKLIPSILIGAGSALFGGLLVQLFDLSGSGFIALIASIAVLFTVNTFRKKKPIFAEPR